MVVTAVLYSMSLTAGADMDAYKAEAKTITAEFFEELKSELTKGMQADGPVTAIGAYKALAPAIALKHSQSSGWDVERTSLELCNRDIAPDARESKC